MGEKAILFGPFIGEFFWEVARFSFLVPYYRIKKYPNGKVKIIVLTREERFDLYASFSDILVPLKIDGDYEKYQPNCYRLEGFPVEQYEKIARKFYEKYSSKFQILEHVYPNIRGKKFLDKNQYDRSKMLCIFKPRPRNYFLVEERIPQDKPIVLLAPRYRRGFKRNWNGWKDFYDLLFKEKQLMKTFNFVIVGKPGEYVPDDKGRFYDMNDIPLDKNSSKCGILLALLDKCCFVCGSQSAIPNIALLFKKEVLEFGHQRYLHTKTYNWFNTPVTFLDDPRYSLEPLVLLNNLKKILSGGNRKWEMPGSQRMKKQLV